jgi:hypothetical protein
MSHSFKTGVGTESDPFGDRAGRVMQKCQNMEIIRKGINA